MSLRNRHANASDLKVIFEKEYGISAQTVEIRLAECGLVAYCPKKSRYIKKMIQKRFSRAK